MTAEEIITTMERVGLPSARVTWFIIIIKKRKKAPLAITDIYSTVASRISGVAPNKTSKGRRKKRLVKVAARPKIILKRKTCPATSEAFFWSFAPKERAIRDPAPIPVPMATAPRIICTG